MRLSSFLLVSLFAGLAYCHVDTNLDESISEFENQFDIKYSDKSDEKQAAQQLAKAEKDINEQNKKFENGESTYSEKLNPSSALTREQFDNEKLGLIPTTSQGRGLGLIWDPNEKRTDPELEEFYRQMSRVGAPASWDSRNQNLVTSVKNQQSCGSCAAFSATSLHETCMLMAGARFNGLDLSEQYLVDCGYNAGSMNGCKGAAPDGYQTWFSKNKGQAPHEVDYPYLDTSPNLRCPSNPKIFNSGAMVTQSLVDYSCTEDKMAQLVSQYGAVSTGIYASEESFGNYGNEIYDGCSGNPPNHAVTVVGYGSENGVPFWMVKNSWGTTWGNNGYFRMRKGRSSCGIGGVCVVSTCAKTPGKPSEPPVAPPPAPIPASQTCDVTALYGQGLTGRFTLRVKNSAGKEFESDCTCTNSVCRPSIAGPSNACHYICGNLKC